MPVSVSWLFENQVIFIKLEGVVTADAALESIKQTAAMLDTVPTPVYLLFDDRELTQSPGISTFRRARTKMPDFVCVLSVSPKNPVQRFVAKTITTLFGRTIIFFDDMPAALEHLYNEVPELRESTPDFEISPG
ncbi:MAG TPA: hypothetical protein VJZ27_08695 [Aggregatilineales bacterium]|nr:hypothetical protein [Aggregatilineales bacterium]